MTGLFLMRGYDGALRWRTVAEMNEQARRAAEIAVSKP